MKLERLPEYLTVAITSIIGILLAFYFGTSAGSGSQKPLMILGGFAAVGLAMALKSRIWILIPLSISFGGSLPVFKNLSMPGAVTLYVFPVFLALKALKIVRGKPSYDWLDRLFFAVMLYLLSTFIRNPVGTVAMGTEYVGGRPYYLAAMAFAGYWVMGHYTISGKQARYALLTLVLGSLVDAALQTLTYFLPQLALPIAQFYTSVTTEGEDDSGDSLSASDERLSRVGFLGGGGAATLKACFSAFRPYSMFNPLRIIRFAIFCVCAAAILRGGFRSAVIGMYLFFLGAVYFREGMGKALLSVLLVVPALCMVVLLQDCGVNMPLTAQRALSFLPVDWNVEAKADAEGSTEWRVEVWKNVWNSGNKYIHNWWLGDGLGMPQSDLKLAEEISRRDTGWEASIEVFSMLAVYHSLPLTTIRTVGYLGGLLYLVFLLGMARYSWQLIRRARGTPFFSASIYVGVGVIATLITGLLVVGEFRTAILSNIYNVALLRLISRSLDQYLAEQVPASGGPAQPPSRRVGDRERFRRPQRHPHWHPLPERGWAPRFP